MKKNPAPHAFIDRDGTCNAIVSRTRRCSSVQRSIVRQTDSWSAQASRFQDRLTYQDQQASGISAAANLITTLFRNPKT
jgi:hypothetical protein